MRPSYLFPLAILSYCLLPNTACADILGPPSFESVGLEYPAQTFFEQLNGPGTLASNVSGIYGSGYETASLAIQPSPSLYAYVSGLGIGNGTVFWGNESELEYSAEVVGPGTTPVPVDFSSQGSTSSSGAGLSQSLLEISSSTGNLFVAHACSDSFQPGGCAQIGYPNASFNVDPVLELTPGVPVEIFLLAASELANVPVASSASASVDPYIYIDPSFADAAQYSIEVSEGVGNSPAVAPIPEPSSIGLLAIGCLSYFGLRLHRRQN